MSKIFLNNGKIFLYNGKTFLSTFPAPPSQISSIDITFSSIPTESSIGVEKTPLRYDKRFALSYILDDGLADAYDDAFKYLNGGFPSSDSSNYSSGKTYTDGCGNLIKFTMADAIFSYQSGSDCHTSNYGAVNLTWAEISEMYEAGWDITSHAFNDGGGASNYEIERNTSYVKLQTTGFTESTSGVTMRIFTQPSSSTGFIDEVWTITGITKYWEYGNANNSEWFGGGSVSLPAGRVDDDLVDGYNRIGFDTWPQQNFSMFREFAASTSDVQNQVNELLEATGTTIDDYHTWKSIFCHSVSGGGGGYGSFTDFKNAMDWLENTHGSDGDDKMWMATDREVYEYLWVAGVTTVNSQLNGRNMKITLDWDNTNSGNTLPTDLRKYALTLKVSGDTSIENISINGGNDNISYNTNYDTNTGLINLEWDVSRYTSDDLYAITWVRKSESTLSSNDKLIAQDYVDILPPDKLIIEDFESGDFTKFVWVQSGTTGWSITTDSYNGNFAAVSGDMTDNGEYQESILKVTMNLITGGTISFYRKVSTESYYDFLSFFIDGTRMDDGVEGDVQGWSGIIDWEKVEFDVSSGEHTFEWKYIKDSTVSEGEDKVWIDNITFPGKLKSYLKSRLDNI